MKASVNILIPDGESTWALPVVRCLSDCSDFNIHILSSEKHTATKYSRHIKGFYYTERFDDRQWIEVVNTQIKHNNIDVVIPIAEEAIGFFVTHKDEFSKTAKCISLPSLKSFESVVDKQVFSEFLKTKNLPQPQSFAVNDIEAFVALPLEFPVLLKPTSDKGGDGIQKFDSLESVKRIFKSNPGKDFFFQDYITGYDIDCSVLCKSGEVLVHTIQKGYVQGHSPYAPQLGLEFLENDGVLLVVKRLMKALDWSGVAHVDLRYDATTNDYKIIEVNPRFWGSVGASKNAGVNFPCLTVQYALDGTVPYVSFQPIKYLRFKGFLKQLVRRPSLIFKFDFVKNNTEVPKIAKDFRPTLFRFKEWLWRQFAISGGIHLMLVFEEISYINFV